MKRTSLCFFLAITLVAAVSVLPFSAGAQEKVIVIGFHGPFTGEHAQYGETFRHGSQMALDHFNKAGGIPGVKVIIKYEDSKSDPKEAINIARKFVDDKSIVGILGDFTSTASMAAAQVYKEQGIVQISPTTSHPDFPGISKWQFRTTVTQAQEAPAGAKWAVEKYKAKRLAIISLQNDWGMSVAEQFSRGVKEAGAQLAAKEMVNPGTRDFRAILTKVSREKPDTLYLGMMYEDGAVLLQQRKQLNIATPIFGGGSLYSEKLIELAGDAAEELHITSPFVPTSTEPHIMAFVEEYKSRFGKVPNMFGGYAYDATAIMLASLKKVGPAVTRATLRDAVAQTTDFAGITGRTTFDPVTREVSKGLARLQIKNGRFTEVKE